MTATAVPRMTAGERLSRAVSLRDAAIAIVKAEGQWKPVNVGERQMRVMMADHRDLQIAYATPFSRPPDQTPKPREGWSDLEKYRAAFIAQNNTETLPYWIDIWERTPAAPRGAKVFSLRWNDEG